MINQDYYYYLDDDDCEVQLVSNEYHRENCLYEQDEDRLTFEQHLQYKYQCQC